MAMQTGLLLQFKVCSPGVKGVTQNTNEWRREARVSRTSHLAESLIKNTELVLLRKTAAQQT